MLRVDLDRQIAHLQEEIALLGNVVDKAITNSVEGLRERDLAVSQSVVDGDDYIDQKRYEIEELCVDLIATRQPMAGDLRAIVAMLHIVVELERMGDYAEGIAKISLLMGNEPPLKPLIDIPRMANKATEMLRNSVDCLVERDLAKAEKVMDDDDEVDELYDQVYRELLLFMIQDPRSIQRATYLLWAAHDLERIADRATNIAERVMFLITGRMRKEKVSKF